MLRACRALAANTCRSSHSRLVAFAWGSQVLAVARSALWLGSLQHPPLARWVRRRWLGRSGLRPIGSRPLPSSLGYSASARSLIRRGSHQRLRHRANHSTLQTVLRRVGSTDASRRGHQQRGFRHTNSPFLRSTRSPIRLSAARCRWWRSFLLAALLAATRSVRACARSHARWLMQLATLRCARVEAALSSFVQILGR